MKKNIWLDGMMGVIVGDALGCPVQFLSRETIRNRPEGPVIGMESGGVFKMPEGTWTDDSALSLATLDSLIKKDKVDPEDIMTKFVKWQLKGDYTPFGFAFDQGNTCLDAIYNFIEDRNVNTCGCTTEYSNGNGSLMRIIPICLYYYDRYNKSCDSDDEAINGIHFISGLTHNHLRSKICCGFYYFMVKSIIDDVIKEEKHSLLELLQNGIDKGVEYYNSDLSNKVELSYLHRLYNLNKFKTVQEEMIKSSGYVIDSIEAAIWCLINTNSYKECVLLAANLGHDTDTIAAIAGGLAGLYYGYESIPEEWLKVIKRRDWIEEMCSKIDEHKQ